MRRNLDPGSVRSSSSRGRGGKATIEALELRVLLSAAYSLADVNGPWSVEAMNLAGSATFDGAGNITGGSFTKLDGSITTPSGVFELAPDGVASIVANPTLVGGINSSKDVLAFSNIQPGSLTVGINSSSGGFSDANLKGTWYEFDNTAAVNGTTGAGNNGSSGHGTVIFDGAGGLTITHLQDDTGQLQSLTGTYTVSAGGVVVITIPAQGTNNTNLSFTGAINNSGDFVAADATDLPTAASTNNSLMLVLIQPVGAYSAADLNGAWAVCTDGGTGAFTFDGAGNVNGTFTNTSGLIQTETGTYTISASGAVSITLTGVSSAGPQVTNLAGSFNASRNVVALDMPDSGANGVDDLAFLIGSGASLQTNTSVQGSNATVTPGQSETFTASVTPILHTGIVPSGSVTFFDGPAALGSGVVQSNGTASLSTSSLALGNHAITASYGGDTSFLTSTAPAINISVAVPAKVGGLDPTFGTMGIASHNIGLTSTVGLAIQSDGKSVIAGIAGPAESEVFALTRYNTDGSVDTSFGNGGLANTSFGGDDQAAAVTLLGNGDILVAGTSTTIVDGQSTGSRFALAEYTSAGVLDTTFGNGTGQILTTFSSVAGTLSNDVAEALAVGADGTIYVGGSSDANGNGTGLDFAVAAYTPSGSPSPAFATNGKVLLDLQGVNDSIAALAVGSNGELIAAGSSVNPANGVSSVGLAEFTPAGGLDPKFGANGKIITSVGGVDDAASALALDAKGAIVVGGYSATGSASAGTLSANFLLLRYTAAGKLDKTFGNGGIVVTSFNQPAAISSVLVDPDGTIIASGKTVSSLASLNVAELDVAIARYTAKGQPDTTFNGTGQAIFDLGVVVTPASLTAAGSAEVQPAILRSSNADPFDTTAELMMEFMQLTQADQGLVATTPAGDLFGVGNNDGNTVEASIVTTGLDVTATLAAALPQSVIGGGKGTVSVSIAEDGTELAGGTFTISLFVSTSQSLTTQQSPVQNFNEKVSLKSGKSKTYRLKFLYPSSLADGQYFLAATVDTGSQRDLNEANNTAVSTSSTLIDQPFVQLTGSGLTAPTFSGVKPATVSFTLANSGNETASKPSAVQFLVSTDGALADAISLVTVPVHSGLKPNAAHVFKTKLSLLTTIPAGTYKLLALLDPANVFNDPNAATNFIVSGNAFVVG